MSFLFNCNLISTDSKYIKLMYAKHVSSKENDFPRFSAFSSLKKEKTDEKILCTFL